MTLGKALALTILSAAAVGLGGCFTGVESTPRIDASTVKKERATGATPEQAFLADIKPVAPSQWTSGKRFRIADSRIARIFNTITYDSDSLVGQDLIYKGTSPAASLLGENASEMTFITDKGTEFHYHIAGMDMARLDTVSAFSVPFTIDLDLVDKIDEALRGNSYYIRTSAWYNPVNGHKEDGLRHIKVKVDSVIPGDSYFPALVCFSVDDPELSRRTGNKEHAVYMSVGNAKSATRNFDVLFAFDNPRKAYPEIKDDVWDLIISSKVREGMSRDECRLALGIPPETLRTPTYGGMREVWSYTDGMFLIFDDGYLTRFRL